MMNGEMKNSPHTPRGNGGTPGGGHGEWRLSFDYYCENRMPRFCATETVLTRSFHSTMNRKLSERSAAGFQLFLASVLL